MEPPRDTERLQLVFSGECLQGHDPQAVRAAVVAALKLDERRAARLFSGKRVVLRRAVDVPTAHRTIARFAMLGAVVRAEAASPAPPMAAAPTAVTAASPVAAVTAPASPPSAAPASPPSAAPAPVPWERVLRWTGLGLAGSVAAVLLGLLLGPGLGTLWPEAPAPADAAPAWRTAVQAVPALPSEPLPDPTTAPAPAPAPTPVAPAFHGTAVPAGVADTELPSDMSPEAVRDYYQRYLPAARHKAFAISAAQRHAWDAGAASADAAREAALTRCIAALRSGEDGCRVIDADGELLE